MQFIRNTTSIRTSKTPPVVVDGKQHNITNSEIIVKATAELSRQVNEDLMTDMEEVDMEDILDAQANQGND